MDDYVGELNLPLGDTGIFFPVHRENVLARLLSNSPLPDDGFTICALTSSVLLDFLRHHVPLCSEHHGYLQLPEKPLPEATRNCKFGPVFVPILTHLDGSVDDVTTEPDSVTTT